MALKKKVAEAVALPESFDVPEVPKYIPTVATRFPHVTRMGDDYVDYIRRGGSLPGWIIPSAVQDVAVSEPKGNLVRVYSRSQQESQGAYVDREMYSDYIVPRGR